MILIDNSAYDPCENVFTNFSFSYKEFCNCNFALQFVGYNLNNEELYILLKDRLNGSNNKIVTWKEFGTYYEQFSKI